MLRFVLCFLKPRLWTAASVMAVCAVFFGAALGALGMTGCRAGSDRERAAMLAGATENMKLGAWIGSEMRFQGYVEREPNPNPAVGELLFGLYCRDCHTPKAGRAAPLDGHYRTDPSVESDIHIIKYGLREMKGFNTRLTSFQILDILAYLEKSWDDAHAGE